MRKLLCQLSAGLRLVGPAFQQKHNRLSRAVLPAPPLILQALRYNNARLAAQVRIVAILAVVLWIALGCGLILVDHLGLGLAVMAHGAFSGIFVALVSTRLTGLRLVQVDGAWAILAGVSPLYFERAGIPELPAPAYLKQYQPDLLAPFMDE